MSLYRKKILIVKMHRFFDAFDLSSWNDSSAAAIAARAWVTDSSNSFLQPFLNFWIVLSAMLGIYGWFTSSQGLYVTAVMFLSGSAARYAIYRDRVLEARWIFLLPLFVLILISPPLINGIRTPILTTIPLLVILSSWIVGRRVMVLFGIILAASLLMMGYAEKFGWWSLQIPLRDPEVWLRAFSLNLICCTVAMASLVGNYQAELRRRFSLESRLSLLNAELDALAFKDSLTGLANRRLFLDRLDQTLIRFRRKNCWGAVLMLDLNRFKDVNDKYGHEAGDMLLAEVALRLRSNVRAADTVARLGGDEFVVLLEEIGCDVGEATTHAVELVAKLQKKFLQPYDLNGAKFQGSVSIGYAVFDGAPDDDVALILRKADNSMYESKRIQSGEV